MKKIIKWLFKFRYLDLWWFKIYLFQRTRFEISIGIDTDGWILFFINFIFISFEIELAPYSYYKPDKEEQERIDKLMNMSEEEKEYLAIKNLLKSFKDKTKIN